MIRLAIDVFDDANEDPSSRRVEVPLPDVRWEAIPEAKRALRVALMLMWDESVFAEFGPIDLV